MKYLHSILFLIACLMVASCQHTGKTDSPSTEDIAIDFNTASFDNYKQLDVVDTTLLVVLSEDVDNDLILGQLDKIVVSDSLIYIADTYMKRLLLYDMRGGIVGKVGTMGGGPGEYTSLSDFCVGANGEIYIYDSSSNKMLEYGRDLKFLNSYSIPFKAERFQVIDDTFLFGLAPYNEEPATLGKMVVLTDRSFAPIATALEYRDCVDANYEFFAPMSFGKEGILYNRVIDNNAYLFNNEGAVDKIFHFDFGQFNVSENDLKNINALLESDKDYCYVATSPIIVGHLLMGVLNKSGEMFTFVYNTQSKQISLNALADLSIGKINLPIATGAHENQLISYFNKDIYPDFNRSDKLSPSQKEKIEQGSFVLCMSAIVEK